MAIFTVAFVLVWLPSVVVYILSERKENAGMTQQKGSLPTVPYYLLVLDALSSLSLGFINFAVWFGPMSKLQNQRRLRLRLQRETQSLPARAGANADAARNSRAVSMTQLGSDRPGTQNTSNPVTAVCSSTVTNPGIPAAFDEPIK